jgi:hypothetical protein
LVSATTRGTLPAAADLLDGALDVGLGHPELSGSTLSIALERAPAAFVNVTAKRLAEQLALGATFLLGDPLRLSDQVWRKRER